MRHKKENRDLLIKTLLYGATSGHNLHRISFPHRATEKYLILIRFHLQPDWNILFLSFLFIVMSVSSILGCIKCAGVTLGTTEHFLNMVVICAELTKTLCSKK